MRRHRLYQLEIGPVKRSVENRLLQLLNEHSPEDILEAEILFRVWYRFNVHHQGRPKYPLFSWATLRTYLKPEIMVPIVPQEALV